MRVGTPSLPPGFDHERFEIRSTLGRGTSSVVYRTLDRQRGAEIALKVLSVHGSASMLAFKREFRSMADLVHPNLVKLYELHAAGAELMFTMELVDGNDFLGFVRRPVGAAPAWVVGAPREALPERATVAEWSGPAPERVPMGLSGELEYFPPLAPEQVPPLRAVTAQVVRGLMALHDAGHVHRDIKPSNVMVDDAGRAVLLDFGVAAELAAHAQAAGTPAYMSPEQAQGERPSPSADFYAVGVMLYEALTGRLPHSSDDPVTDKLTRDPAPPSTLAPDVPVDLDRLCMALLSRDPSLRPEGSAILDLLCGDSERTLPPRHRTETPLLGRDVELRRIESAMREVSRGTGRVVLVTGRSGIGKSALMRQFLVRARRKGAVVLTGRCYEQESVPYKALDAVMDAVCQHLASLPIEEREDVMPRHRWALGRLFPVLAQFSSAPMPADPSLGESDPRSPEALQEIRQRQTLPVTMPYPLSDDTGPLYKPPVRAPAPAPAPAPARPSGPALSSDPLVASRSTVVVGSPTVGDLSHRPITTDPARIRRQGVTALRQLLESLARHAPLIIAIDDLQWGDLDSAQVLAEVLSPPQPSLLLLGSFRREDQDTSEFLRTFLGAQSGHEVISLEALDPGASLELARSLVRGSSRVSAADVAEVAQVSKGDPFLLVELARYVSNQDGPKLTAHGLPHGLTVEAVVRARIRHLEAPARRLLEAVSVAAGPVARTVARRAADLGPQESTAVVQLRAANLLRVKGTRGVEVIETYHDRIRDAVQEQLGDEEHRAWHLRLVDALQAEGYIDHERIGKHLEAAGRRAEAVPRYLQAAAAATTTLAFDRAAELYRRALAPGLLPTAEEVRVRSEYADVLMRQSRFDEASSELGRCRTKMSPGEDRARIFHRLGEVELSRGDVQAAIDAFEHALADLGHPVPEGRRALWLNNLREVVVQVGHTWFPARQPPRPAREAERLAMRIYSRLTYAYYFNRGSLQVFWPHLRELNSAERHPPTPELGRAYAGHGMMLAVLPWFRRGLTYVDRGLAIQRRLGDRWGEAQAMHQQGVVLYGASRFAEAARVSADAAERLEAMGDAAEAHDALLHVARAKLRLGHVAEATALARRVHEEALDSGDVFAAASSVMVWTMASGGRVPSMMIRVQVEIAAQIDHRFTKLVAMQAAGVRLLGVARPAEAAAMLDQTAEELHGAGLMSTELLAELDVWRATAWRRVAEEAGEGGGREEALAHARRALRRGLWSTSRFRNGLPHALREAGRLAALRGGMRRAKHLLEGSLALAVRHQQAQEIALTRLVQGGLFGGPGGAAAASVAEAGVDALAVGLRLHGGSPQG
jgi:serine/threonine protein kinase/predicted ATPase